MTQINVINIIYVITTCIVNTASLDTSITLVCFLSLSIYIIQFKTQFPQINILF